MSQLVFDQLGCYGSRLNSGVAVDQDAKLKTGNCNVGG